MLNLSCLFIRGYGPLNMTKRFAEQKNDLMYAHQAEVENEMDLLTHDL